jgi:AraC-like DNA-binding protein
MTTLFYREHTPPPDLTHLVLSFWEFTAASEAHAPIDHEIFSDGCISLAYRRNMRIGINGLGTNALNMRSVVIPVFDGDTVWGVRLHPAACARVLGTGPAEWETYRWDGRGSMFDIFDQDLLAALSACSAFEEAIEVYSARLRTLGISKEELDKKVIDAVSIIEETMGETRMAMLADQLGLSVRQFERRFKKSAGLSPKFYSRARRFRAAAAALVTGERINWADRAAAMGFADQAHLAREFSYLTGRSPKSFALNVKKIDHGTLV